MTVSPPARRLSTWLITGALATLALAIAALLFVKLASSPDTTKRLHLPGRIDRFTQRDGLAYPLHAALGTAFNLLPRTAEAAGIQWMKAADHTRSPAELTAVVNGILRARARAPDPVAFTDRVCSMAATKDRRVLQAIGAAGLSCNVRR